MKLDKNAETIIINSNNKWLNNLVSQIASFNN